MPSCLGHSCPVEQNLTLCVLLWARPGAEAALVDYEDRVLKLVPEHGGRVLQRARSAATDEHPLEIQMLQFPSRAALDAYMGDGRRSALAGERDAAVEHTEIIPVTLT